MQKNRLGQRSEFISNYIGQIVTVVFIFVFLSIFTDTFLTERNLINVPKQIAPNMYISCGLTLILLTGGIDLSVGSIMALAGMVASYLSLAGAPFWVCASAGFVCGTLVGIINGLIIANTTLHPFIVTYCMQSVLRGMVYVITTAGTLRIYDPAFLAFGGGMIAGIPWPIIYMFIVILVSWFILDRTRLGRQIYAIGGNIKAAAYAGINIKRDIVFIYALSGFLAAQAGLVYTSRSTSMQPTLGTGMEMDAIAAVVLGGTSMAGGQGGIFGTVAGALIIGLINNGLNLLRMDSFWQYIVKGIVILIAVYIDCIKNKRLLKAAGKD